MRTTDISIVFQGVFKPYVTRERDNFIRNIKLTRRALPGAQLILSTWEGSDIPAGLAVDAVVLSQDPGALAPLKLNDDKVNNINRQIVTARAGLAAVTTSHAVKMRTDCFLEHAGFLDFHAALLGCGERRERLLACSFFTVDPTIFEHLSYHLSDWFQFGTTAAMQRYWSAPTLPMDQARYYETHPHAAGATIFEQRFRARFAVEQHLCMCYAGALGYHCPAFLNQADAELANDYRRFLAHEVMLLDPWQIGLVFPKYHWVGASLFQSMNNLMHLDWLAINEPYLAAQPDASALRALIARRARKKSLVRQGFHASRWLHPFLFDPAGRGNAVRKVAHRLLRYL